MDSDLRVQSVDISDSKTSFRKPSNDAASRKYRRRSPHGGSDSSSSDGSRSPRRENRSSKARNDSRRSRDQRDADEHGRTSIRSSRPDRSRDRLPDKYLDSERRRRDHRSDGFRERSDYPRHRDRYPPSDRDLSGWKHDRQRKPEPYERDIKDIGSRSKYKDSRSDVAGNSSAKKQKASLSEHPPEEEVKLDASSSAPVDISEEDINAARAAAMKAAELVNKNIAGSGVLSAAQKKKLLWGNKKNEASEEKSGNRWDVPVFSDRERQEKFNKLMGVKGEAKPMSPGQPDEKDASLRAEKEKELQIDLEKQYTAGLRRRDGRTVGLGL